MMRPRRSSESPAGIRGRSLVAMFVAAGLAVLACPSSSATGESAPEQRDSAAFESEGPLNEVAFWEDRHRELEAEIAQVEQDRRDSRAAILKSRETVVRLRRDAATSDEEIQQMHAQIQSLKRRLKELEAEYERKLMEVPGIQEGTDGQANGVTRVRDLDAAWRDLYVEKRSVWKKLTAARKKAAEVEKGADPAETR